VHGKIVGRGDIPDGHGYRWAPGVWFLAAIAVVFLRLVPKTRGVGGFCCMGRRGCHPDLRVGAENQRGWWVLGHGPSGVSPRPTGWVPETWETNGFGVRVSGIKEIVDLGLGTEGRGPQTED